MRTQIAEQNVINHFNFECFFNRFNFFNLFLTKLCGISLLFIMASYSNANIQTSKTDNQNHEIFIEFQPGVYSQPKNSHIQPILKKINQNPHYQILLVGLSQSAGTFATYALARTRAEVVKKMLVNNGIEPARINISSEYENFKVPEDLIHGVIAYISPDSESINRQSTLKFTKTGFVPFLAGVYDQPAINQPNNIAKSLLLLPKSAKLKLVGISQSKNNLATKPLALMRAETVANQLINAGIDPSRIELDTKVTNNITDNYLIHGVDIFITNSKTKTNKPLSKDQIQQINSATKNNQAKQANTKEKNRVAYSNSLQAEPKTTTNKSLCAEFEIQKGSLKENIQREITDCGYQMGQWKFGTDEEYIDWLIPIAYKIRIEKGIFGVLKKIETNYQIRAHIHQLDKSIDFLPSINRAKAQGQ